MTAKKGLLFSHKSADNEALGREFLDSPEQFAKKREVDPKDFVCPDTAHQAMRRGDAFASEVKGLAVSPTSASMKELSSLAAKHFGNDFKVAMIPYGLQFCENASIASDTTGSGTVTFLDADGDVDEMLM
jgi:hypothetical protein